MFEKCSAARYKDFTRDVNGLMCIKTQKKKLVLLCIYIYRGVKFRIGSVYVAYIKFEINSSSRMIASDILRKFIEFMTPRPRIIVQSSCARICIGKRRG